ncbi:TNF receptor-associated factor 4-like isoform X2 [Oopsacas minuta]|uniref:TNF receptor-associated factor 4-like isoform X2 n=1 Tax=Oopsacas minuta TaxID=111878 RepID=A0AAV7JDC5_9METZ|nr:TNF receptor-associated factor 4-like isoform X2 [Oopsacas minuta]
MEVGCDTIEIARKNLETHITQNVVGHQKLLLHELNQLRTENKQLRADNEQLRADNEQLRVTNERHEQSIQSHEQSILYSCTLLSTGQLEWKIKGVKQKIENKEDTYSDPFYAGLYKCQGCIQWNCLFFSKVGVYICIMKGDYDDKLHWPIRYKYTFIILNHINSNNNYEYTNQVTKEYLEKYPDNLKKPTQMRNQGYANFFISKTEILEAKYCKEDSITLLIKIELLPAL